MYWLWKWLESYNNCTFSTWKDKLLFNLLFLIPNSFCTFHGYARGGTPFLPPLSARHWFFIIQIFEQLSCSEKQSCLETFHCDEKFFIFQDFSATCGLSWKTECALNSLYWIYIYLTIQNFKQLAYALKNRVCPEIFHYIETFLSFRIFEKLARAPKTEFVMKFFAVFKILFTFKKFEQLLLDLKNIVSWIHCIESSFRILNNLRLPWKTEFALKIFTALK